MKDIQRFNVLKDVINKKLTGSQAAELLGLSYIHISRLKKKLLTDGFEALLRKSHPSPPNKKITDSQRIKIIKLRRETYPNFNINHFKDKLNQLHHIHFSYTSMRQILIDAGLQSPKKKKIIHRQKRRMPKAGMLIQMDSSQHRWLEHIPEKWWLTAMIDDATNEVPYARFFPKILSLAKYACYQKLY
jgi:transposase